MQHLGTKGHPVSEGKATNSHQWPPSLSTDEPNSLLITLMSNKYLIRGSHLSDSGTKNTKKGKIASKQENGRNKRPLIHISGQKKEPQISCSCILF